jgi:hypothetical protein
VTNERHAAAIKTIVFLAAHIYQENDLAESRADKRTRAQRKQDALNSVEHLVTGLVDDAENARPIAREAIALVYGPTQKRRRS